LAKIYDQLFNSTYEKPTKKIVQRQRIKKDNKYIQKHKKDKQSIQFKTITKAMYNNRPVPHNKNDFLIKQQKT
jgi:hypothetical protein